MKCLPLNRKKFAGAYKFINYNIFAGVCCVVVTMNDAFSGDYIERANENVVVTTDVAYCGI